MFLKIFFRQYKAKLRNLSLQFGKILFDCKPPQFTKPLIPNNIRAILFLRQDGKIGDFIVSSFAFREIKKAYPHIHIGVICSEKNHHLFINQPYIDALHKVKAKSKISYYKIAKSLAGQYDVVIEPTQVFRLRDLILLHYLAAPFNIGLDKADFKLFNLNITNTQQHYIDIYHNGLQLCGFEHLNTQPMLPENSKSQQNIQNFLSENGLNNYIALNFFGAAKSRRFSNHAISNILTELTKTFPNQKFLILTAPDTTQQLIQICSVFKHCWVYKATESITDSIELIRYANLVISPDTAIVHIAAALDKKIIGLYQDNPQNLVNWYPKTKEATLLFFRLHIDEITPQQIIEELIK